MQDQSHNLWDLVAAQVRSRCPSVLATIVRDSGSVPRRTGAKMLVRADGSIHGSIGGGTFELLVIRDAQAALAAGQSVTTTYSFNPKGVAEDAFGAVCGGRADVFLEVLMPTDRLLIVGGGHCGRALAQAASPLGFSIVIADDREEFSRPESFPFPGVESVVRTPPDYRQLPPLDPQTYIVILTKGHITDEAALRQVIGSPAAYIGMIGSRRKRDAVYSKLRDAGITDEQLARVHCPIGLDIGADSPEEIAISILAEILQHRAAERKAKESFKPDAI